MRSRSREVYRDEEVEAWWSGIVEVAVDTRFLSLCKWPVVNPILMGTTASYKP